MRDLGGILSDLQLVPEAAHARTHVYKHIIFSFRLLEISMERLLWN